jgi:hypothetical protein
MLGRLDRDRLRQTRHRPGIAPENALTCDTFTRFGGWTTIGNPAK